VERPLGREHGSVFCICCWPLPAQSFSSPRPLGIATIFYCLRFETSLFVASYGSQGHGGGTRPRLHTGTLLTESSVRCVLRWSDGLEDTFSKVLFRVSDVTASIVLATSALSRERILIPRQHADSISSALVAAGTTLIKPLSSNRRLCCFPTMIFLDFMRHVTL
jgi:hypothetical protein